MKWKFERDLAKKQNKAQAKVQSKSQKHKLHVDTNRQHGLAKLLPMDVRTIRALHLAEGLNLDQLLEHKFVMNLKISRTHVRQILNRDIWKNI